MLMIRNQKSDAARDHKSKVRVQILGVRKVTDKKSQESKRLGTRGKFKEKSIGGGSTYASKHLPDSITSQKVKRKSHQ